MSDLIDKLIKARQVEVKIGKAIFTATRYTGEQWSAYCRDDLTLAEICRRHVTGFAGVTEKDVFGEGTATVPFDKELLGQIIADRADWASKIVTEMGAAYAEHIKKCNAEVKK